MITYLLPVVLGVAMFAVLFFLDNLETSRKKRQYKKEFDEINKLSKICKTCKRNSQIGCFKFDCENFKNIANIGDNNNDNRA